jgi:membrane protein
MPHQPERIETANGTGRLIWRLARAVWREAATDRTMLVAAGLAFFALFGLLPAVAAAAVLYGQVVDAEAMQRQLLALGDVLPEGAPELLAEFLAEVPAGFGFGLALAGNLAVIFWTVQRTVSGLITALNITYDVEEKRGRMRREAIALAIAIGGMLFLFASLLLVVVVPYFTGMLGDGLGTAVRLGRWPLLAVLFMLALGLLYKFAPCHSGPVSWKWVTWGGVTATMLWLLASILFSLYITVFGIESFSRFYGTATSALVLLTWLFIGSFAIIVGAEINQNLAAAMSGRPIVGLKKELDRRERAED